MPKYADYESGRELRQLGDELVDLVESVAFAQARLERVMERLHRIARTFDAIASQRRLKDKRTPV